MNTAFWKNKRVLITGHNGFKGSWLSLWLQEMGSELLGFSLDPPGERNLFEIAKVGQGMQSVHGDICDLKKLSGVMQGFRPDIVLHLAAQPLVRRSYADAVETYTTNVMGTVHLLEAVRRCESVRSLVIVTTDKCYQNREWYWGYRENEALGGHDPYSSSKGCAELVTAAYRSSFFAPKSLPFRDVRVATARAGNCIGGGDWGEDRLIPDMIRSIMTKRPLLIRNPLATRPWQFVLEPLRGYLLLAEKLWEEGHRFAEGWNFGSHETDARPVSWIADQLVRLWGQEAHWTLGTQTQVQEACYLKLDSSKAREMLGWQPRVNISAALQELVFWYQAYLDGEDMAKVTRQQIRSYAGLAPDKDQRKQVADGVGSLNGNREGCYV